MDTNHNPGRDSSHLSSTEYRTKLLTKLNCLIAVLEVAIAKISRTIDSPGANEDRLLKIRGNLENTLSICSRAKQTLERSMTSGGAGADDQSSTAVVQRSRPNDRRRPSRVEGQMSYRDYVELSSIEEYRKFKSLPPIAESDFAALDVDDLLRKLAE